MQARGAQVKAVESVRAERRNYSRQRAPVISRLEVEVVAFRKPPPEQLQLRGADDDIVRPGCLDEYVREATCRAAEQKWIPSRRPPGEVFVRDSRAPAGDVHPGVRVSGIEPLISTRAKALRQIDEAAVPAINEARIRRRIGIRMHQERAV